MAAGPLDIVTGALGCTGRYITRRLLGMARQVATLTDEPLALNPFGRRVPASVVFDRGPSSSPVLRVTDSGKPPATALTKWHILGGDPMDKGVVAHREHDLTTNDGRRGIGPSERPNSGPWVATADVLPRSGWASSNSSGPLVDMRRAPRYIEGYIEGFDESDLALGPARGGRGWACPVG